jgi:hypothetical protein
MARYRVSLSILVGLLLVIPTLFVMRISPTVDEAVAQELGPKQSYLSGPRSAEAPVSFVNQPTTNSSAKPSGKMSFVPASPAPRDNVPKAPRAVANPVARRDVSQPPKYSIAAGAAADAQRSQNRDPRAVASRPAKPQPSAIASKTPMRTPAAGQSARPQQPSQRLESLDESMEPVEVQEPVVVAKEKPAERTLEEPEFEEPALEETLPAKAPGAGVVQLYFEDEPADEEPTEMMDTMDIEESPTPIPQREAIRHVAAQGDTAKGQSTNDASGSKKSRQEFLAEMLEDLKPVGKIDLRKAVVTPVVEKSDSNQPKPVKTLEPNEFTALAMKLPDLSDEDGKKIDTPNDVALAMMQHRKPFNVVGIARAPWQASRDSYPFYHKPLWFEDPNMERCGRGWGPLTTTVSAIRASANIPILPYRFTAEKPWSCVRTLPDCTVCEKFGCEAYLPPWSLGAAAVQAAATVGVIYIVP